MMRFYYFLAGTKVLPKGLHYKLARTLTEVSDGIVLISPTLFHTSQAVL